MAFQSRQKGPWTPYHGLLTGMSLCDIIFSVTLAAGSFLFPKDTSDKYWALGNVPTCNGVAFMTQFSYSTILYNAMLSFYFLLTARYGYSNEEIAARFETIMHVICLFWPLGTAYAGLYLDFYGEREANMGCWVRQDIPRNCGSIEQGKTGEECLGKLPLFLFAGLIFVPSFIVIVINNLRIWWFGRKEVDNTDNQLAVLRKATIAEDTEPETSASGDFVEYSLRTTKTRDVRITNKEKRLAELNRRQQQRLKLLRSQAVYFVAIFLICNVPTYVLRFLEASTTTEIGFKELSYRYFPLLLLQSFLYPLQGLMNMFVYLRPKFMTHRANFPMQSKLWVFRRSVFGSVIEPKEVVVSHDKKEQEAGTDKGQVSKTGEDSISSHYDLNLSTSKVPLEIRQKQVQVSFRMDPDSIIDDSERTY
ncbi:unnamed protein product [Cylindrotheca closterium]|uniref:G-protein coupled receptors family 1 profile domain-containing protein n=1 Tax=Cylindrotheca closterium TaxID=2856 RepID=A0AAD2JPQ9_9STRA|nr:unnamed protein product [Cylindrotheca closterium]